MVHWLGLGTITARAQGSIPGRGTKILQVMHPKRKKKKKRCPDGLLHARTLLGA